MLFSQCFARRNLPLKSEQSDNGNGVDMYRAKWTSLNLPLGALDAAKRDTEVPCPVAELGNEGQDQVSFSLPTYQRGLVWTDKHGRKFQNSLASGWPIGEIVLAEREPIPLPNGSGQQRQFDVIDGQQRTHWLNRTRDRFWADSLYSLETSATTEALEALARELDLNGPSEVADAYREWTAKDGFVPSRDLEDLNRFLHFLVSEKSTSPPVHDSEHENRIQSHIIALNSEVKSQHAALTSLKIPTLVIRQALREDLHEIFQELNSGTKLSDLDLLAAEWSSIRTPIAESSTIEATQKDEIFSFARNRISDTYEDEDYTYNPDLSELQSSDLSLFDTLYGLGKLAHKQHQSTFAALTESCDRLALFTASILFAGGIGSRKQLATHYPDEVGTAYRDVSNFPKQFLQACKEIDSAFTQLNAVKAGKKLKGRLGLVQAATYLAAFIVNVYWVGPVTSTRMESRNRSNSVAERKGPDGSNWTVAKRIDAYKSALVGWFLRDVLQEEFQGSDAYTNAAKRVWRTFDREESQFTPNHAMLTSADGEELNSLLESRFYLELEVSATPKQRRYSEAACAIVRVAYSGSGLSINDEEIDHVLPFDLRLNRSYAVPINHPANLMPLKKRLNGKRSDRTLDVFLADDSIAEADRQEALDRVLIDPEYCSDSAIQSLESFQEFAERRYRVLGALALASTKIPGYENEKVEQKHVKGWFSPQPKDRS